MAECEICGATAFTNRCNECGMVVCGDHILPENHNCDALLAEKASAEWFKGGDREQVLGKPVSDDSSGDAEDSSPADGEYTVAEVNPEGEQSDSNSDDGTDDGSITAGDDGDAENSSPADGEYTVAEANPEGEQSDSRREDGTDDGSIAAEDDTVANVNTGHHEDMRTRNEADSKPLSKRDWSVNQTTESGLRDIVPSRVASAVSGLVSSILHFVVGGIRLCGVGAVWGGAGLGGWRYLTGGSLEAVGSAFGVMVVGIVVVYVTAQ